MPPRATDQDILLDTALGNPVPNVQDTQIGMPMAGPYFDSIIHHLSVKRTPPDPRYNCHGLTFASRRTKIIDDAQIRQILVDDRYVAVERALVLPGDVAVYFADDGSIEHSAIVVSTPSPPLHIPRVCSKWGFLGEVVHLATECPLYAIGNIQYFRVVP